ncbi:MAG: phosphoglycerate kinase [Candidatus Neomarinimicrobiota bacterium]
MQSVGSLQMKKQRVLMRVDFNVPLRDGMVSDDFRIRASLPTINYCLERGCSIVLMSHLGRPHGRRVPELSLLPVGEALSDLMEKPLKFSDDCISDEAISVSRDLLPGEVHLLENLRFYEDETRNDEKFSQRLSKHGMVYVNDAFGTAHRAHASNVGVTHHFSQKAMGFLMEREYRYLHQVLKDPRRPLVMVLGGAKVRTKLSVISRFLRKADCIIVGGGMAFTFLKARGFSVGKSLVEKELVGTSGAILSKSEKLGVPFYLPRDIAFSREVSSGLLDGEKNIGELVENETGVDIGSRTIEEYREVIRGSGTVVWNGPMGIFELPQFRKGTRALALSIAEVAGRGGISIIGGGDTAAAIRELGLSEKMSHISTGGGAFLELMSGKELPAFETLEVG